MQRFVKLLLWVITGLLVVVIGAIYYSPSEPHSQQDISIYSKELFEFGAIDYVHSLGSPHKDDLSEIFDHVALGQPLTVEQSRAYRVAYSRILQDYAGRFQAVDQDLYTTSDFGMAAANNCQSFGVEGEHDLHDLSAKANFSDIRTNLEILTSDASFFRGIFLINDINKDLVDLVVHMAPAVHSIGVHDVTFNLEGEDQFNAMQRAFKSAQFSSINSNEYWASVDAALLQYETIVMSTQQTILSNSTKLQRKIAGRWLALQTIAPRLEKNADRYLERKIASRS